MNTALVKPAIRCSAGLVLILTLALAGPANANAQLKALNWIGYGAAGATLGLLATSWAECTGFICIPPEMVMGGLFGLSGGIILGVKLGGSAEASVERGEPVRNLWAVTTGAVLGGAFLSVIVGGPLLASRDPGYATGPGGEEQSSAAFLALVGAGLATLYLRSRWDELTGKTLEVTPAIVGGEAGLTARIRF